VAPRGQRRAQRGRPGLFLGIGYHHWAAGAFNAVFGSLVGEAIILTQPTGLD